MGWKRNLNLKGKVLLRNHCSARENCIKNQEERFGLNSQRSSFGDLRYMGKSTEVRDGWGKCVWEQWVCISLGNRKI